MLWHLLILELVSGWWHKLNMFSSVLIFVGRFTLHCLFCPCWHFSPYLLSMKVVCRNAWWHICCFFSESLYTSPRNWSENVWITCVSTVISNVSVNLMILHYECPQWWIVENMGNSDSTWDANVPNCVQSVVYPYITWLW